MPEDRTVDSADSIRPATPLETTADLRDRGRQGDDAAIDRLFARHLRPCRVSPAAARAPTSVDAAGIDLESGGSRLEEAVGLETMAAYEQGLSRLKLEEREAVIGRLEMGFSYEELALALEKPTPDAARKAAQRALVRLAEEMQRER